MRSLRSFRFWLALALAVLACPFTNRAARAAELPSDLCTLLSSAQLEKTLEPFGPAEKSTAPAAYLGQPSGSHCEFSARKGTRKVVFIVYVDKSAPEAKQTFEKLSAFYPAQSKPSGVGDSAYIDKDHAIHVLKGKVRYYISISPMANEKQLKDLANSVAAQI
jgi:hypothetical protein